MLLLLLLGGGLGLLLGRGLSLLLGGRRRFGLGPLARGGLLGLALHLEVGLARPALLLLLDELAELGLGVLAGLRVLDGLLVGGDLRRLDLLGRVGGGLAGVVEAGLLGLEVGDGLVVLVGGGVAGAQRDPRQLVARQAVGDTGRAVEDGARPAGAGAHVRLDGDLGELAPQRLDGRLLLGDVLLGRRHLGVELILLVDIASA